MTDLAACDRLSEVAALTRDVVSHGAACGSGVINKHEFQQQLVKTFFLILWADNTRG